MVVSSLPNALRGCHRGQPVRCCQRRAASSCAPAMQSTAPRSHGTLVQAAAGPAATAAAVTPSSSWTVGDMLTSLQNAERFDPQAAASRDQHEAATAVNLAKQTLMTLGYSIPLASGVRDSFCAEGGLEVVLRLLPHPELQYLAMSALVALLGTWTCAAPPATAAARAAEAAARSDITQALLLLLAPGNSWVIQGRCCGMLSLLIRQELRTYDPGQDAMRRGMRWELLHGGGITALTSLLRSNSKEAVHQASTTLGMLTRFRGRYRAALLAETALLPCLVDFCATLPPHASLVDVSLAIVNLCDTDSALMQQQVVSAGAVHALMQMQSLEYTGPCQDAARKCLATLAASQPQACRQILDSAAVQHPLGTQPAEWVAWWRQLQADLGLL